MCGITGWVSFDRDLTRERDALDAMTQTMACRGPDASGTWVDRNAALGHRRLAVIDLVGGVQPMSAQTPHGEVTLVYSGEVYNFVELREELIQGGQRFSTDSDTEVVLRGYLQWGAGLAERLIGMYAFAIWDARDRKLVMIRDRIGIKPLYYYPTADGVLFGSEPKAILANPIAKRVVDVDGLREALSYVHSPRQTFWSGMRQVEPATIVTVDAQGLRERTYWRLETRPHTDDLDVTVGRIRELLDDSVRHQIVADVPHCVLLSGGLDSSTLTALAAAHLGRDRVRTFAVDFRGYADVFKPNEFQTTDDAPFVRDVVRHVGADHTDIVLDSKELANPEVRRAVLAARDIPVNLGDMDFSLYLMFAKIRKRSTVALSGECADEIFGGYKHMRIPQTQQTRAFPWLAIDVGPLDKAGTGLRPDVLSTLALADYQRDMYDEAVAEVQRSDSDDDVEHRMRVIIYLHLSRFIRNLLDRKDRLSMAVGLEVRVPFCDHRLIDYVYNTSWAMKNYDGMEKSLLRGAVKDMLPESVAWRPKSAYPSTQDPYYTRELQEQSKALLSDPSHAVFELVDRNWLAAAVFDDSAVLPRLTRLGLERALDLALWLDLYRPDLELAR
ncbi:MAG TPA: asparagine synthase (glutamine-hydrolyzing) [Jatrophihabitans sp.]|jgi:asparagine synthase (glutamine-hydrolysing)|nr:asparagine synthase (glutamine-hydrolyzing) [Jatrophihabitans sp.]